MRRDVRVAAPGMDAASAAWVRAEVLGRHRVGKRWVGPNLGTDPFGLIDECRCQWGRCGNCKDLGKHELCAHRAGTAPADDGREGYLINGRTGAALTPVWVAQVFHGERPGCRWICPCLECENIGAAAVPRQRGVYQLALF